jgi:hypothetical protein
MDQLEPAKQEEPAESETDTTMSAHRIPLENLQESDEVYERIGELTIEVAKADERVGEIDGKLKALRQGVGDLNDLMDFKALRDVCHGRHLLLQSALKEAEKKLESISNSTRSMLVKALASLRTVLFKKLRRKQKEYDITRSERVKRERDDTEKRMDTTTESLALERKSQSQSNEQLRTEYDERVSIVVVFFIFIFFKIILSRT